MATFPRRTYACSMRIAYVTVTIISEKSGNPCPFQQCTSDAVAKHLDVEKYGRRRGRMRMRGIE